MIKISVVRATIIRNTRMVSTMDPFCKVTYGEHSELTEVATDAGKKPEWDAKFEFPYDPEIVSCVFLVYDKDGSKDIFVSLILTELQMGNYSLNVSDFFEEPFADEVNLNKSGTNNGKLFIKAWVDKPEEEEVKPPQVYVIQHAPPPPPVMLPPSAPPPPVYAPPPPPP